MLRSLRPICSQGYLSLPQPCRDLALRAVAEMLLVYFLRWESSFLGDSPTLPCLMLHYLCWLLLLKLASDPQPEPCRGWDACITRGLDCVHGLSSAASPRSVGSLSKLRASPEAQQPRASWNMTVLQPQTIERGSTSINPPTSLFKHFRAYSVYCGKIKKLLLGRTMLLTAANHPC